MVSAKVYITASIFLHFLCWFPSLPVLSTQRSIYCCFSRKSENCVSAFHLDMVSLFREDRRVSFLVIYSQVLTFQFISFFPELLAGSLLSVWFLSPGTLKRIRTAGQKVPLRAEGYCKKCVCHMVTRRVLGDGLSPSLKKDM